jgi:hypothetical protein
VIRIAVSARAYRAIKATLPAGSAVYPPERNGRGEYLLWLTEAGANRLAILRRRGESYSDAVIRMAKEVAKGYWRCQPSAGPRSPLGPSAFLPVSMSPMSRVRSICANCSASSLDSKKVRTVSWSSMVTVTV